jgi:prepilin-type N-terminal cleavage/methylation domain-containing protein
MGSVKQTAFTLIEILIVILILAVAALIVVPNIGSAGSTEAVSAARVLQADLDVARSMALTTQVPTSVVFSSDLKSYMVTANYAGGAYTSTVAVNHPVNMGQLFQVTIPSLNGMSGVRVTNVNFGGLTYVTFDSLGAPSSAGTITLQCGTTVMVITIDSLTGVVSVARTAG